MLVRYVCLITVGKITMIGKGMKKLCIGQKLKKYERSRITHRTIRFMIIGDKGVDKIMLPDFDELKRVALSMR